MSLYDFYLFMVVLPNLHNYMGIPAIFLFIGTLVFSIASVITGSFDDDDARTAQKTLKTAAKTAGAAAVIVTFFLIISPTEQQIYKIAGGYVATNTKDISKLPDNLVKAANAWLDKAAALA